MTTMCLLLLFCLEALSTTARDVVPNYTGDFGNGMNLGWHGHDWGDEKCSDITLGNPSVNQDGLGCNSLRLTLPEWFLDLNGYTCRTNEFTHYGNLGAHHNVVFLEGPSDGKKDTTIYCTDLGQHSKLWSGMYLPIFDAGGPTPVNENNYLAYYVYKTVSEYGSLNTRYWELVNEPDFTGTKFGWQPPGNPGNWWDKDPNPCNMSNLLAPIQHYVRALRITYEVVKSLYPDQYICLGGVGYPSFVDAVLRNTDNPVDGSQTSTYPYFGGAYFDCLSYHNYPMYSLAEWSIPLHNWVYKRHSDEAVKVFFENKDNHETVLSNHGYGTTFPSKRVIVTETNIPNIAYQDYIGSHDAQRNYVMKVLAKAPKMGIDQIHFYMLSTTPGGGPYNAMGFYENIDVILPYNQVKLQSGIGSKTVSDLTIGKQYDDTKTSQLNLPPDIEGYAFLDTSTNKYIYCLWAKTNTDMLEIRELQFTFPSSYTDDSYYVYEWDWSSTNQVTTVSVSQHPITVNVHANPIFIEFVPSSQCTPPTFCKNGGTCDGHQHCSCIGGWTGNDCSQCGVTCQNGATCKSSGDGCNCVGGWTGNDCNTCGVTCQNGAECKSTGDGCNCNGGWTGNDCGTCGVTCYHGGNCKNTGDGCENCDDYWTGNQCNTCSTNCKNGGTCKSAGRYCNCVGGWTGNDCSTCGVNCLNGASCKLTGDGCNCIGGWKGNDCGTCGVTCYHSGRCKNTGDGCENCDDYWTGNQCNTCSTTCQHGGTCKSNGRYCNCVGGWTGNDCGTCGVTCYHGSTCKSSGDGCNCVGGWTGNDCNTCGVTCKNGAECKSSGDGCNCNGGWTGNDCGTCGVTCYHSGSCKNTGDGCENCDGSWIGNECNTCSTDCQHDGACKLDGSTCNCVLGWKGDDCSLFSCSSGFCQHDGICVGPQKCSCVNDWSGDDCSGFSCSSGFCQNGGSCNAPEKCLCLRGYTGNNCSELTYYSNNDDDNDDDDKKDEAVSPGIIGPLGVGGTIGVYAGAGVLFLVITGLILLVLLLCLICCLFLIILCCLFLCFTGICASGTCCGSFVSLLKISNSSESYHHLEVPLRDYEEDDEEEIQGNLISYPKSNQSSTITSPPPPLPPLLHNENNNLSNSSSQMISSSSTNQKTTTSNFEQRKLPPKRRAPRLPDFVSSVNKLPSLPSFPIRRKFENRRKSRFLKNGPSKYSLLNGDYDDNTNQQFHNRNLNTHRGIQNRGRNNNRRPPPPPPPASKNRGKLINESQQHHHHHNEHLKIAPIPPKRKVTSKIPPQRPQRPKKTVLFQKDQPKRNNIPPKRPPRRNQQPQQLHQSGHNNNNINISNPIPPKRPPRRRIKKEETIDPFVFSEVQEVQKQQNLPKRPPPRRRNNNQEGIMNQQQPQQRQQRPPPRPPRRNKY